MAKLKAGQRPIRPVTGFAETDRLYHILRAPAILEKEKNTDRWKQASAAASNRLPLNGQSRLK